MPNRRRSQRVLLRMPIDIIGTTPDRQHFCERTVTLVVNAHGALVVLSSPVTAGQVVILKNPETSEEQACRIASIHKHADSPTEVGIEFVKPAPNFWRVTFPPSDWVQKDQVVAGNDF